VSCCIVCCHHADVTRYDSARGTAPWLHWQLFIAATETKQSDWFTLFFPGYHTTSLCTSISFWFFCRGDRDPNDTANAAIPICVDVSLTSGGKGTS